MLMSKILKIFPLEINSFLKISETSENIENCKAVNYVVPLKMIIMLDLFCSVGLQ